MAIALSAPIQSTVSPSQYPAVKAFINSTYPQLVSTQDFESIATALNTSASPAFTVWQSRLTPDLARTAIMGSGAAQLDNLTQIKLNCLLFAAEATMDARDANVRAALDSFTGSQATLKASIVAAEKRLASVLEKLLANVAGGAGTDQAPATATFEGTINVFQIGPILNS